MEVASFQKRIAVSLLIAHVSMFLVIFLSYLLKGLSPEDLQDILKILIPVNTLYMTAIVKFIVATGRVIENAEPQPETDKPVKKVKFSSMYRTVTWLTTTVHVAILILVILLNHVKEISFADLMTTLPIIESLFGVYAGIILLDLFMVEKR